MSSTPGNPTQQTFVMGIPVKYVSLVVLVVQNSALFLSLRASRDQEGPMYNPAAAVVCSESLKLFVSLLLIIHEEGGINGMLSRLHHDIIQKPGVTLKLLVPAGLYTLQNNLLYLGASYLDAATFQVTYQFKVLTTALFSVIMLGKALSLVQWLSLVLLMSGIALIQLPDSTDEQEDQLELNNKAFGLVLVMAACFSSGFAGVYFEKMLKGATAGIWILNVQLASFSVVIALTGLLYTERENIVSNGFFYGFSAWTYTAIGLQAIGGLVVAVVVKYADNILKGFATSISIVISCLLSVHFFDFVVTNRFGLGTVLVLASSYLYGTCPPVSPRTTNAQPTLISVSTEKR